MDENKSCKQHAKEIILLVQTAAGKNGGYGLPPRCNLAMQPIGKPVCGHFTRHRKRFLGEGHAAGYPDWQMWKRWIAQVQASTITNKGVKDLCQELRDTWLEKKEAEENALKILREAILQDGAMQQQAVPPAQPAIGTCRSK